MLLTISIACTVGALVGQQVARRYTHYRGSQRRGQLLVQALRETGSGPLTPSKAHLSPRRAEMENLLAGLQAASEALAVALETEALTGQAVDNGDGPEPYTLQHWQAARAAVGLAQETYNQAAGDYREFVQTLPPPLRAIAAQRGFVAMTANRALV
jgi:hypothetical protein